MIIEVSYTDLKTGTINFLKFSNDPTHRANTLVSAPVETKKETYVAVRPSTEKKGNPTSTTQQKPKPKDTAPLTPFKRAILEVFKASKESSFDSIKTDIRAEGNFW